MRDTSPRSRPGLGQFGSNLGQGQGLGWTNRYKFKDSSPDYNDTDELGDDGSDTTEIIYPPDSTDLFAR